MDIRIPAAAMPYVLLQRTQYLRFPRQRWCTRLFSATNRLVGRPANDYFGCPLFKPAVRIEALLRRPAVRAAYSADLRRDFETIMPHLPQPCRQVLDIGCGIAGIDVLLHRHLDTGIETLHLLDKSAVARQIFYGFNATGAFYNSLSVARGVLSANGVPESRVRTLDATPDNGIPIEGPLDLIISILSWGFHYPVQTYLERAHALLRPGGRLILDVRKGQGGEALLERRFGRLQVALDMGGAVRVVATK